MFEIITSVFVSCMSLGVRVRTFAWVPTMTYAGVFISPCAVVITPVRALEFVSFEVIVNDIFFLTAHSVWNEPLKCVSFI